MKLFKKSENIDNKKNIVQDVDNMEEDVEAVDVDMANDDVIDGENSGYSILIVDDSKFSRQILRDILKDENLNVVGEAVDGMDSIDKVNELKPDVIFMDVAMPKMDGLTAVPIIIDKYPDAHIIMCTAMGQQTIISEALKVGAKDYVVKPYRNEGIMSALKTYESLKEDALLERQKLEQEKLEQEKLEEERLEQEKQKQERLEKEKLKQETLEQERLEQERLEQEKLEQEKLEQEKLEQEKLEQEKLEQEKLEQEKLEQEKSEQEKLEQEKLEQEKIEQEKLEQEKSLEDDKTIGSLEPLQELGDEIEFSLDSLEILDSLDESETSESLEPLVSLDSLDALDALDLNDSQESLDSLDPLFGLGNATEPLSESDDSTEPILEHEENTKADIEEEQMLADKLLNKDLAETVEEIEDEVESNYETDYLDEAATTIEDYSEQTDSEIDNIDEDADIEEVGINNVERYKFLVEGNDIRALTGTPLDSLFDIKPNIIEEKVIQVREELVNNSLDSYESFDEDNPFSYLWRNRFDHRFTNKQFDFDELEKMCVDDFISSKIDHELMRAIKSIKNIDQLGLIKAVNCGSERLHPDKTTIVINRSIKSNKRVFTSEMLEDMSNEKEISIDYLQKIDYEMIKSEEEYIKKETQLGILLHDLVMEKPQRLIS